MRGHRGKQRTHGRKDRRTDKAGRCIEPDHVTSVQ